jgi:hypothetical protein
MFLARSQKTLLVEIITIMRFIDRLLLLALDIPCLWFPGSQRFAHSIAAGVIDVVSCEAQLLRTIIDADPTDQIPIVVEL